MGNTETSLKLKVFTDKKKTKVMFAEAQEDFVEILFSFLTVPLGKIARHSSINVGSLSSLRTSVLFLDVLHFHDELSKNLLSDPRSSLGYLCTMLKINLNYICDGTSVTGSNHGEAVLVKKKGTFIITDDLIIMPFVLDKSINFLKTLGVEYNDLKEQIIEFDSDKFFDLLKWSLCTNTPLTNVVCPKNKPCLSSCSLFMKNSTTSKGAPREMVKLLVHKSKRKVLCAHVDNFFVELLFSFLTIPLGLAQRLTQDTSTSSVAIDNLCNSISSLGDENYLKSYVKAMFLNPKLASNYKRVTNFLPIYEDHIVPGSFLWEQQSFLVSDDLKISVLLSLSAVSKFTIGIPVGDIEVLEVGIGEPEALLILRASLTSTSALTDFFFNTDLHKKHR